MSQVFNFKKEWWPLLLITLTIIFSIISYPMLPDRVISHWNFQGQADGWSSKSFHSIFFPALIIAMYLLFLVLPLLDPKRERYQEFAKTYNIFKALFITLFFVIFVVATLANLNVPVNIGVITGTSIGIMFMIMGNYLGKIKSNWFMGIRNPWTLSSENVWNKTHRLGGRIFMIWGLSLIILPWLPTSYGLIIFVIGLLAIVIGTNLYSYIIFTRSK